MKRDIISVLDMKNDFEKFVDDGIKLKKNFKTGKKDSSMDRKTLAMIFEKASTRTRVSFETAMTQLGGHAIYLSPRDMQMGRGETIADTGEVLSGMVDAILYRAFKHDNVVELAQNSSISVINGLDNLEHPTQIVADYMTIKEKKGKLKGLKIAYVGDGNNTANSLMLGAGLVGADFWIATPEGYEPPDHFVKAARSLARKHRSELEVTNNYKEAVAGADVIYTDVWVSMGEEQEREKKEKEFKSFQINEKMVSLAKRDYIFMHCLPAHRGLEVTNEVADSKNSVIFQEAENRLHAEKIILKKVIK
ncbi:MAG: ornithine carbamoyltransferase [Thermoplasmatales archaeon]|nr:ornithine carbamoyltransferase [Candidatus Thermoplasmatota archaeon]MDA8054713.1 ornithine carbamoyltransferase [Thermoplasmatales archaeon]